MRRCKCCLLPETFPKISFNEKRICNYCLGEQHFGVEGSPNIQSLINKKDRLKKEFEEFVEKCKGKKEYDCLLLFSGGKDSTYLLHILREKYELNVLTLTIDTGLMSPIAKKNIKQIIKKLNVDHIFFTPGNEFYKSLYRYYLTRPNSETYCDRICGTCSNVIHGIGLIEASKRKIPFVALANSPDQTDHYFYEIPRERISQSWIPKELESNDSEGVDPKYFWNPKKEDYLPRFLLPLHVLDYPGEAAIVEMISKLGLVKKKDMNSFKTNCYLVWLLQYLDLNKSGYDPYIKNLSKPIQNGKIQCSKLKKLYYTFGIKLLKSDIVKRGDKEYALNYLGLNMKKLFKGKKMKVEF
jgi:hypothetical protein